MKTAEAIACIIVSVPMFVAMVFLTGFAINQGLSKFYWWESVMAWFWGDWKPRPVEEVDDAFLNMCVFLGIALITVPILTVLGYCFITGQYPPDYIIKSWQEIRFV